MLKIDYVLETKNGSQTRVDHPNPKIQSVDGNVLLVESPSSCGKSTVMNMIAIGAYGETNDKLSPSVRADLHELSSASYRDLEFNIEISDDVTGTTLKMIKESNKKDLKIIEIKGDQSSYLSCETFRRKYNLIYDVPEDPTKRLEQIRDVIKDDHNDTNKKLGDFLSYIKEVKTNLDSIPDKQEIDDYRKELAKCEKEKGPKEKEIETINSTIATIDCIIDCIDYENNEKEIKLLDGKISTEMKKPIATKTSDQRKSDAKKSYSNNLKFIEITPAVRSEILNSKNTELIYKLRCLDKLDIEAYYDHLDDYSRILGEMKKLIPDARENEENESQMRLVNDLLRLLTKVDGTVSLGELGLKSSGNCR